MATFLQPGRQRARGGRRPCRTSHDRAEAGFSRRAWTTAIPFDTTRFVDASIKEVIKDHLSKAAVLVARGWCFPFSLQDHWGAPTIIPMIAVPVSLIGAFAGLWGGRLHDQTPLTTLSRWFSPSASWWTTRIVVLENVERLDGARQNMPPLRGGGRGDGARWSGAVGRHRAWCSAPVFVAGRLPLGGIAGRAPSTYRQFAVTLTFAVVISGFMGAHAERPGRSAPIMMKTGEHQPRIFRAVQTAGFRPG